MTCHQPLPRCGDSPPGRDQWKQPSLHHRTEELQTPKPGSLGYNYNYHHICHRFTVSPTSFNITSFHGKKPRSQNAQGAEVESTQGSTKGYSTGVGDPKIPMPLPTTRTSRTPKWQNSPRSGGFNRKKSKEDDRNWLVIILMGKNVCCEGLF